MTLKRILISGIAALGLSSVAAIAEPAMIFDMGGKFDKSFNEAAHNGAKKWAEDTGRSYKELEMQSEAQREQALRRLAQSGANPIVMTGFSFAEILNRVATSFPDTRFVIIDSLVDQPNVQSAMFSDEQGSYLAGIAAGMTTKTNVAGFIGGMDIPLIRRFGCGFAQGLVAANPDAKIIYNMIGTTPNAWNDPVRGGELVKAQQSQGADIVYAAAGGSGIGVLQAAADLGILSIGVDSNQNYLHPGQVLTSVLKRVDVAVYDAFEAGNDIETGVRVMDLASNGTSLAIDEHNKDLMTDDILAAIETAKAGIIDGSIKVHDYSTDNTCPVEW